MQYVKYTITPRRYKFSVSCGHNIVDQSFICYGILVQLKDGYYDIINKQYVHLFCVDFIYGYQDYDDIKLSLEDIIIAFNIMEEKYDLYIQEYFSGNYGEDEVPNPRRFRATDKYREILEMYKYERDEMKKSL